MLHFPFYSYIFTALHIPFTMKVLLISIAMKFKCLKTKNTTKSSSSARGSNSASPDPYLSTLPFELTYLLLSQAYWCIQFLLVFAAARFKWGSQNGRVEAMQQLFIQLFAYTGCFSVVCSLPRLPLWRLGACAESSFNVVSISDLGLYRKRIQITVLKITCIILVTVMFYQSWLQTLFK